MAHKRTLDDYRSDGGESYTHRSRDQIVIGLDFGTTFSGVAYAIVSPGKTEVHSIMEWPGCEKQPKVDTLIAYDPDNPTSFTWGRQKHRGNPIIGLKLLLDPSQETPLYLPAADWKADILALGGRPVVDVAADYIGALYRHAMTKLESKIPSEFLAACEKQHVLTVPAVWSDKAKSMTRDAAEKAGIFPVDVIKEPQAAALYTFSSLEDRSINIGDAFVLCDAGGGTVDLISYEVVRIKPILELKELVPSKGGMAGSLGLNRCFAEEVRAVVGEDQWYELHKTRGFEQAARYFNDNIKVQFRGDLDEEYDVVFPRVKLRDDPSNNLETNCWTMSGKIVAKIFEPFVHDITRYIKEQTVSIVVERRSARHSNADSIKAIFLVGGFGSSEYLKLRLQQAFPDIQIIQPHDAWAAVVKGAVLSKIPQQAAVMSFKAQRHYGVAYWRKYDAVRDAGQPTAVQPYDGSRKVERMEWYVNTGDNLQKEHKVRFRYYISIIEPCTDEKLSHVCTLYQCESEIPAKYPGSATTVNCTLKIDLTKVDKRLFEKMAGKDGNIYTKIEYDLVVHILPAMMKFSMEIEGVEQGSVATSYD